MVRPLLLADIFAVKLDGTVERFVMSARQTNLERNRQSKTWWYTIPWECYSRGGGGTPLYGLYSLDMDLFLRRSHFIIIIENKTNKSPSQIMFTVI